MNSDRVGPATVSNLVEWLDLITDNAGTPDYPGALNGLHVDAAGPVTRIAAAVDASLRTVEMAAQLGVSLLIVHHGLFWGGAQRIAGAYQRKLRLLLENDMAVYSSHLPLDRHATFGNNVLLAAELGLTVSGTWHAHKGVDIGVCCRCDIPTETLVTRARRFAAPLGQHVVVTPFADGRPSRLVAICSGSGASTDSLHEAVQRGADTLIVGEGPHHTAVEAEELGLVVIYAGHYATETLGVQALARAAADRWQLPWSFIPAPTGL
jgi:dinuclear metal center YbgI/SA1388 family protein